MRRKWNSESVKVFFEAIPSDDAKASVEEIAEMVYSYLCQLPKDQSQVLEPLIKRTGSDD